MFDKPQEIIFILNLLLLNDKRPPLIANDIFTKGLTNKGRELLTEYSTGYVSYLRGADPLTFPVKVYPKESKVPKFKFDYNGEKISKDELLQFTKIVQCQMSAEQFNYYNKTNRQRQRITFREYLTNSNKTFDSDGGRVIHILQDICNIVYPLKKGNLTSGKTGFKNSEGQDYDYDNGLGAFYSRGEKFKQFSYQSHGIFKKGTKKEKPFLDLMYLSTYSCKISKIIKYILEAKGTILVYSRYIYAGILPLALALEQNGVQRYLSPGTTEKTAAKLFI